MSQKSSEISERQRRAEEYFLALQAQDDEDVTAASDPSVPDPGVAAGPDETTHRRTPREIATYAAYAGALAAVLLGLGYATDFPAVVWLGWVAAAVATSITLLATVAGGVRLGMHHALLDAEERRARS